MMRRTLLAHVKAMIPLGLIASLALTGRSIAQEDESSVTTDYFEISTRHGRMVVRVYDDAPLHRDNFTKLASEDFYDGTTFHRVIANFMIQGGDPNSKNDDPSDDGQGGPGYTIPAEISTSRYHKRGALAAARQADQVNPNRASSGSQFYLVLGGRPFDEATLRQIEQRLREQIPDPDFAFTPEMIESYTNGGGAPHLDGLYTVFGELVEGFDVLDAIGSEETPRMKGERTAPALFDQPLEKVEMEVRPLSDYTPPSNEP